MIEHTSPDPISLSANLCSSVLMIFEGREVRFIAFSDFIWNFGKLPFHSCLGKYFMKIGKINAKIHEIGKIKFWIGNDSHIRP